jgi:hypothetical protein
MRFALRWTRVGNEIEATPVFHEPGLHLDAPPWRVTPDRTWGVRWSTWASRCPGMADIDLPDDPEPDPTR